MVRKPVISLEVDKEFKEKVGVIAKRKGLKVAQFVKLVLYAAVEKEMAA